MINYQEIILQFMQKRNIAEQVIKKIILKGNITTTYIENKCKSTETSILIHLQSVRK